MSSLGLKKTCDTQQLGFMSSLMEGQNSYKNTEKEPRRMAHRVNKISKGSK
jgi:hypothetical protein